MPFWRIQWLKHKRNELNQLVEKQTASLLLANRRLDKLSRLDELTDIANRREFISKIEKLCDKANHRLCLALLDVDDFKAYNDYYGHVAGDECLINVAKILDSFESDDCLVARLGGEEFVMLFDSYNLGDAKIVVNNMIASLELQKIPHKKSSIKDIISISVGLVCRNPSEKAESLINRADMAMYQAKAEGKDCLKVIKSET